MDPKIVLMASRWGRDKKNNIGPCLSLRHEVRLLCEPALNSHTKLLIIKAGGTGEAP
ncbi:MAG: hypothetical protein F7B11_04610 [Caldisphaeraceae archaeon]|nr:hypothetical protein [Caldisphaeraceae archaeon]